MLKFTPYTLEQNKKSDTTLAHFLNDKADIEIYGYPDDEGIKANGGKVGAKEGPNAIRQALYKMTPDFKVILKDCGNLSFSGSSLKERHDFAIAALTQSKASKILSFGGGHDYGYVDGASFLKRANSPNPLIVNFDAHFDLRDLSKGITSGTPFYRLTQDFKNFELIEIGIQKHCNSKTLYNYAKEHSIKTLSLEELYPEQEFNFDIFKKSFTPDKNRELFISIDIDGFNSAIAPGCSQSWPSGFSYNNFIKMYDFLISNFNVKHVGIYEVSPPLDHGELTSRLAALLGYRFLQQSSSLSLSEKA